MSVNFSVFDGNLAKDFELKEGDNWSLVKFTVANKDRYKDSKGEWKERTYFYDCEWFGKYAKAVSNRLKKGTLVVVTGMFVYDDRPSRDDASKKTRFWKVRVEDVVIAGEHKKESEPSDSSAGASSSYDDDIPF